VLALGGAAALPSAAATPLDTWKQWATNVTGSPVDSGHFLTEENPEQTAKLLREFFLAG
jgi:haloacetate dehalogenase